MIDTLRTIIIAALVFVGFLLWQAWQLDFAAKPTSSATTAQTTSPATTEVPALPEIPALNVNNENAAASNNIPSIPTTTNENRWISVKTDLMNVSIDTLGGSIVHLSLIDYPKSINDKEPLVLLDETPEYLYIAESGLVSDMGPDIPAEQSIAQYQASQNSYTLNEGEDTLTVTLNWIDNKGLQVEKQFIFHRGQYEVDLNYVINNQTTQNWVGSLFLQFKRNDHLPTETNFFALPSYFGAAISSPDKRYEKISLDDLNADLGVSPGRSITDGWFAMVQHYFVSAWVPNPAQTYQYAGGLYQGDTYFIRAVEQQSISVAAGQQGAIGAKFYAGPKITSMLKEVAPKLELTVDYGWLWPISQGLFWVMQAIYDFVGNWGVAIILVTVLIKLAFYKLSATSYRSMANMRRLQPKFVALKERYGDDRQKMSQELMNLYKKEKINPLGGCLPILVQIPVFIALYWVLIESVEFRQAPFMLWIQDLSVKDPYYILPLLMGVTMFIQQKLSPQPPDPLQAKVMMFMPIVFTVVFLNFPAGLVLYWLVNNILSIAQQWYITRKIELQAEKK